jgi:hypothetical protein
MNYLKNYTKKEIKLDPEFTHKEPEHWQETDSVKELGSEEYPIDKTFRIVN